MSGQFESSGRMRVGERDQIVRQAVAVAGLDACYQDPRALAVALGYQTVWAPRLPHDLPCMVVGRTIYYANAPDDAELARRVALALAHLILEAWGYDIRESERLSLRLAV
jgi:hypothetical protein